MPPHIIISLVPGLVPERPTLQVHFEGIEGGWPVVAQMMVKALDTVIVETIKALNAAQQEQQPLVLPVTDMPRERH